MRKHTVFGLVVLDDDAGSDAALRALQKVEVDDKNRPRRPVRIKEVAVLVDPFERFLQDKEVKERGEREEEEVRRMGGREDERVTWTGKRVRLDGGAETGGDGDGSGAGGVVGRYLKSDDIGAKGDGKAVMEEWEGGDADGGGRVKKKIKGGGGFGNFDGW